MAPPFSKGGDANQVFRRHAKAIEAWNEELSPDLIALRRITEASFVSAAECGEMPMLTAALNLLTDLVSQRWQVRVTEAGTVEVRQPDTKHLDAKAEKERIRAQELMKRNEQLKQPATQRFVKMMERRRLHAGQFVSIFSLMRDGRELATSLRATRNLPMAQRPSALREVIDPYLQFVSENATCKHTGLRLQDIWRYFRHTWSNQYTNTPGRTMAFLVRDRAVNCHPIIGICALGSPIVQIRERDAWIGWHPEAFLECLKDSPSVELGRWLIRIVDTAVSEIFLDDFFQETYEGEVLLLPRQVVSPTNDLLTRLTAFGENQRKLHHRLSNSRELKRSRKRRPSEDDSKYWEDRAKIHLFRSKRALSLAEMLRARMIFRAMLGDNPSIDDVRRITTNREGCRIIKRVLRKAKADRVGISMADITVCGAVPPYSPILGGKLVSMLAASPEVTETYEKRYREAESEIASSMAGRPIVRPSALVFLGTTSLYSVGSSQYNRVRVPANRLGGGEKEELRFIELGRSEAYGTSHFSDATVKSLVSLVQQSRNGQRVNSIFGEGVSPKLRKIRDGLNLMNLPTDVLLQHGRHRIVYGIPLIRNLREYLLGMDDAPDFIISCGGAEATRIVADWWLERWLSKRIDSDDALESVAANSLVCPVRHGARVVLLKTKNEEKQLRLFEDLD